MIYYKRNQNNIFYIKNDFANFKLMNIKLHAVVQTLDITIICKRLIKRNSYVIINNLIGFENALRMYIQRENIFYFLVHKKYVTIKCRRWPVCKVMIWLEASKGSMPSNIICSLRLISYLKQYEVFLIDACDNCSVSLIAFTFTQHYEIKYQFGKHKLVS